MSFNTSILVLALVLARVAGHAQDSTEVDKDARNYRKFASFSVGAYSLSPMNDGYVKDGLDLNTGFQVTTKVYVTPQVFMGAYYSLNRAKVVDPQITGNYEQSNISALRFILGYELELFDKTDLSLSAGIGQAHYKNKQGNTNFIDRGVSATINPVVTYRFYKGIGVFLAPELRMDKLNIEVPTSLKNDYGASYFFATAAGIDFKF